MIKQYFVNSQVLTDPTPNLSVSWPAFHDSLRYPRSDTCRHPPPTPKVTTQNCSNYKITHSGLPLSPESLVPSIVLVRLFLFSQWLNSLTCLIIFYFLVYWAWDLLALHFIVTCVLILYTLLSLPLHLALWQNPNSGSILLSAFSMPLSRKPSIAGENYTAEDTGSTVIMITTTQKSLWLC